MTTSRRSFLKLTAGAAVIIAAPAIVRASSLMPVKALPAFDPNHYIDCKYQWFMMPPLKVEGEATNFDWEPVLYGDTEIQTPGGLVLMKRGAL